MEKFYITTAIDYVNDKPHIGHALEKIQGDVLARFWRARLGSENVFFLRGTDEHGAKIARAALAAKQEPQAFVDSIAEKFRGLDSLLGLSSNDFIRTTDRSRHWPGVLKLWQKLMESGDIYKKAYEGLYCVGHEAFVTQKDLIDGKCADHQKEPEVVKEENYFFRLSKYSAQIGEKIRSRELKILPESKEREILSLIEKEGLEDVSFSRPREDLSWGIPVPGDETQTIYVWCDALANYMTAVGYGRDETLHRKWWPADAHLIGKDILRFHAAIWPGMLLSAGLPLPKHLLVHGFITVRGRKMSKTIGNVIDPFELVGRYGVDPVRYYLLREIPSGDDGDFSDSKFRERYNGDLANGLGNFAARVLALGEKIGEVKNDGKLPSAIGERINAGRTRVDEKVRQFRLHEALAAVWELISFEDPYVNEKKPWETNDPQTIAHLVVLLDNVAALLAPFLPETAEKITRSIEWRGDACTVTKGDALFPRVP